MDKLKIHDKFVGIKKHEDGYYTPKNTKVLQEVFESGHIIVRNDLYDNTPIPEYAEEYYIIDSFCTVATKELKEEACILLMSLRQFHDQPVCVTCDEETKRFIQEKNFKGIEYNVSCNKEELRDIEDKFFNTRHKGLGEFHRVGPIFKKMESMNYCLKRYNNTFFLDADIIVLNSLQEKFTKPVCLSPHYYPQKDTTKGFRYGFYNAGYIFTTTKEFPNIWKWLYLNDSSFYEQEGMNRIPDFTDIQVFGDDHNFGLWRDIDKGNSMNLKSLHAHLSDRLDSRANPAHHKMNLDIRQFAFNYIQKNNSKIYNYSKRLLLGEKCFVNHKIGFIHFGKCAGTYTQDYMYANVIDGYEYFNSWWHHPDKHYSHIRDRDFTGDELMEIADRDDQLSYVHNHHINWTTDLVQYFKDRDFKFFTFLRDPKDLLCSLFFWSKEKGHNAALIKDMEDLNELFTKCLSPGVIKLWCLPEYIDMIDNVSIFSDDNFGTFLDREFGYDYKPTGKRNTSSNKGFLYYYENGYIDKDVVLRFQETHEYRKYFDYGLEETVTIS